MAAIYIDGVRRFLEGEMLDEVVEIDEEVLARDITQYFFDGAFLSAPLRSTDPTPDQCGRIVAVIVEIGRDRWTDKIRDMINVAIGSQYRSRPDYREQHPDMACEHLPVYGL